jgi:hypothetical protein
MVVFLWAIRNEKMRYPNSRYGNPEELKYYSQGMSIRELARQLKRSEKSVKQWLSFEKKVPYWVPELLRLRHMEADLRMRQMGFGDQRLRLGIVKGTVIDFPQPKNRANMQHPDDRTKTTSPLENGLPTEPAHHRPSLPHSCNAGSQNATGANQDAQACSTHTRTFGTVS